MHTKIHFFVFLYLETTIKKNVKKSRTYYKGIRSLFV
jgi:hypothetical protein